MKKKTVEDWEKMFPVGTAVKYYPIKGDPGHIVSRVRSEVWEVSGNRAVVLVEGKSGGVACDHLEIIKEPKP